MKIKITASVGYYFDNNIIKTAFESGFFFILGRYEYFLCFTGKQANGPPDGKKSPSPMVPVTPESSRILSLLFKTLLRALLETPCYSNR